MSIIKRFSDIMASNINAVLDKMEDPEKMIDQLLRNLEDDLNKVKGETAGVMADEARAKRVLDECTVEVKKMQDYAERAVKAGNDDDARKFLTKKAQLTANETEFKKSFDISASNSIKMKQMYDKLVAQINDLNSRKDSIKAKISVAKAQERINKIGSSSADAGDSLSAFARMEQKADRMLDQADAMAKLNSSGEEDNIDGLMDKYETSDKSVNDELNALKANVGGGVEDELAKLKAASGKE